MFFVEDEYLFNLENYQIVVGPFFPILSFSVNKIKSSKINIKKL